MDPEMATDEELAASRAGEEVKQEIERKHEPVADQENGTATEQSVSDEVVRERLLLLLDESDLATTTEKMLRKQLEEALGVKLNDRKALIREEVLAFLDKKRKEEGAEDEEDASDDGEEEEQEQTAGNKKKRNGSGLGSLLSEPLQAFLGVETMPRPQVVKALWTYIREHNLQDPKNKRKIILDQKLSTIFTPPLDMLNMNKQLSKHCFTNDVVGGSDEPKQRPAKKQKKSTSSSKGDDGEKRKPSGFCKPIKLSDQLAAATGEKEMNRGAVMKWMYDYAKKNDLMDPSDKRYIIADSTLKQLTGESRFLAFGAQKLFSKHFLK